MRIAFVELQNFRKLKKCRIDFSEKETIFVGANNSGKTSAITALGFFLKDKSGFTIQDFTLSNWKDINEIGDSWIKPSEEKLLPNFEEEKWNQISPQLDVWFNVKKDKIHYVNHLLPTLDWKEGLLGVRLVFMPNDLEKLYHDFKEAFFNSTKIRGEKDIKLWPKNLRDFIEKRLHTYFSIKAYILDPKKINKIGAVAPQKLKEGSLPIETSTPFKGLIRIDTINAQRGFNDPNGSENTTSTLSSQLQKYYREHLDPEKEPTEKDLEALTAIEGSKKIFDQKLTSSFQPSINELQDLNYPGFGNPNITISSKIIPVSGLDHDSAVRFRVNKEEGSALSLPEKYNGLGYQNLISMVFKLIRFRDSWMQVGKITKGEDLGFEPLHLVLMEEPEAHLHAQAQQVFIKKAYDILRKHKNLGNDTKFSTQLIVSTHSNHIAHEADFSSLRYFKRYLETKDCSIPTSEVINLSETFGKDDRTSRFASRYLKTTHCNLFFADATILVEGAAERMLVPHFIKYKYKKLSSAYISLLEIGGSHAHRLKPLLDDLGIITLIITDLDSVNPEANDSAVFPELNKKYTTGNSTLKKWCPKISELDKLLGLKEDEKVLENVRVAYQSKIEINGKPIYPYTFEDALGFSNIELFKNAKGNGFIKKLNKAFNSKKDISDIAEDIYKDIRGSSMKKAEFALELLYLKDPNSLNIPQYISDGLNWLENKLYSN